MGRVYDEHQRGAGASGSGSSRCSSSPLRRSRPRGSRQPLAQGVGLPPSPIAEPGGVPRPHRQRERDGSPPGRERWNHVHVLRVRRPAADPAELGSRIGRAAGEPGVGRADRPLSRYAPGARADHRRGDHPGAGGEVPAGTRFHSCAILGNGTRFFAGLTRRSDALPRYRQEKNTRSIDGLPGLEPARSGR